MSDKVGRRVEPLTRTEMCLGLPLRPGAPPQPITNEQSVHYCTNTGNTGGVGGSHVSWRKETKRGVSVVIHALVVHAPTKGQGLICIYRHWQRNKGREVNMHIQALAVHKQRKWVLHPQYVDT